MSLNNLINELKNEAQKEIVSLEKESSLRLQEIDQKGEQEVNLLNKEKEEDFSLEKKKTLDNYLKEKEFQAQMDLLELKNKIAEKVIDKTKEKAKSFEVVGKKEIFKKELEKIEKLIDNESFVYLPLGSKNILKDLFQKFDDQKIIEKDIGIKDGFVVEGKKFIFKVDLEELIDQKILEEKSFFFNLLFEE